MRKIGILGGTFDPVHDGHLALANEVMRQEPMDEIWFLPTNIPSHKDWQPEENFFQRCNMLRLALLDHPSFRLSIIEEEIGERTYTYHTLQFIESRLPEKTELYFITGADAYNSFRTWFRWEALLDMATFLICQRPGVSIELDPILEESSAKSRCGIRLLKANTPEISSTALRGRLAAGKEISSYTPLMVEKYIQQHNLYQES